MKKFDFDKDYKKGWLRLGFFYDFNDALNRWEFSGDRPGLENFYKELIKYTESEKGVELSEHIHLGPYSYLKIVTWAIPIIKKDGFYGSTEDLKRLADTFTLKLKTTSENDHFTIDKEYSQHNEASLTVYVKKNGFDPSSLD